MLTKLTGICLAAVLLVGSGYARDGAQKEAVTAEQVVQEYIRALGGLDRLRAVQSRKTLYTVHMQTVPPYQVELTVNRGGELKSRRLAGDGCLFFSGGKLWNIRGKEKTELTGPVVGQFRKKADLDGPLVDSRRKGIVLRYLGTQRIEFSRFRKLEVTWPDGVRHVLYFDQRTGLLKKQETPAFAMVNGKTVRAADTITCFYDYRDVKGIKVPFAWVQTTADLQYIHLFTVQAVELQ